MSTFNNKSFLARDASEGKLLTATATFVLVLEIGTKLLAQQPVNDSFSNAINLTETFVSVTNSNIGATKEPGEPYHAGDAGGASLWWTWTAPSSSPVTIWTEGSRRADNSQLDTLLAVYVGTTVSHLTVIASNDDNPNSPGDLNSQVTFSAVGGTTYHIAVDGLDNPPPDVGTIHLSLIFGSQSVATLGQAPAWSFRRLDGATIRSTNFSGNVILLNFWATWCGPCIAEIPDLVSLKAEYAAQGFSVIGISVDASPDGVNPPTELLNSFASARSINYPIGTSFSAGNSSVFSSPYIPTSFIIDRNNGIVRKLVGGPQSKTTLESIIRPLLYENLRLNTTLSNGQLVINWKTTPAPVVVEASTNVSNDHWTVLDVPRQSNAFSQSISLPLGGKQHFFRLRLQ